MKCFCKKPLAILLFLAIYCKLTVTLRIQQHNYGSYKTGTNMIALIPGYKEYCPYEQAIDAVPIAPIQLKCYYPRMINPANGHCQCQAEATYHPQTNECRCPKYMPVWNGKKCVRCPQYTSYDSQQKQCYVCPEGFDHVKPSGKWICSAGQ